MTDREKVIEDLQDAVNDDWMWQHADFYARTMEKAIQLLKEQPDIVECKDCSYYDMVACKDCMYYDNESFECKNDDIDMLIHHCGCYPSFTPGPNWFCAYGTKAVRRE